MWLFNTAVEHFNQNNWKFLKFNHQFLFIMQCLEYTFINTIFNIKLVVTLKHNGKINPVHL